jgi:peptide/nickel transport system permease protein
MDNKKLTGAERIKSFLKGLRLNKFPWLPVTIIVTVIFVAIFADLLTPYSPYQPSLPERLLPPAWDADGSAKYLLGTDSLGRDILTRIFFGARITLLVALLALIVGGGVGLLVGVLAGYLGGKIDSFLMRVTDVTMAFPTILFALLLAVTLGPGILTVVLALGLVLWARFARIIRGEVLALKEGDFIAQAKIDGCSPVRIMLVHIIPNILNTVMVLLSLNTGWVIVIEATLGFLGAGIPPPTPSWGQMAAEGREFISTAWWLSILPGLAIGALVLSFNLFGDWLRDAMDPKLRQI